MNVLRVRLRLRLHLCVFVCVQSRTALKGDGKHLVSICPSASLSLNSRLPLLGVADRPITNR